MANLITDGAVVVNLNRSRFKRYNKNEEILVQTREVLTQQSRIIAGLATRVGDGYMQAVEILVHTKGHVVVSGMGKSGLIGKKIAATFASTGTPSFFVHPGEAYHGDLGMVRSDDTIIFLSKSGETEEVIRLLPFFKHMDIPVISLVGNVNSTLAIHSDAVIDVSVDNESCPNNLAPTNSTLATLAMGDALAVSLMKEHNFNAQDFARFHPGGTLGRRLLTKVRDAMHEGHLPRVSPFQSVRDSLVTMSAGRLGLVLVIENEKLLGIVTDGDLRRALQAHDQALDFPISRIMTAEPVTILENAMLADAEKLMHKKKIKALVVLNNRGKISGILEIFDD